MRRGGFDVFEGMLNPVAFEAMTAEAIAQYDASTLTNVVENLDGDERGGSPARRFLSAGGGTVQQSFYRSEWMLRFLTGLAGGNVTPTGEMATFSYYVRPGDHIDVHRDVEECDLAVITCLLDSAPERVDGSLCVYPDRMGERVREIRETRDRGFDRVHLAPGQTIVLLGGIVPHRLDPVGAGQQRVVSVMCYSVAG